MRGIFRVLVTVAVLCHFNYAYAQQTAQNQLDSLIAELPNAKEDSNKVILLHRITGNCFQLNPEVGVEYGTQAFELAQELNIPIWSIRSALAVARCHAIQNNTSEALKCYDDALVIAKEIEDKRIIAIILSSIGVLYNQKEDYAKALECFSLSKEKYKEAGIKNISSLLINLGNAHNKVSGPQKALEFYLEGIRLEEQAGSASADYGILNTNAGGMYVHLKDYSNALKYLFKALVIQKEKGNEKSVAFALNNIGEAYLEAAVDQETVVADSLKNKNRNLSNAQRYLEQSLAISEKLMIRHLYVITYYSLSRVYEKQGNHKAALEYYTKHTKTNDSLRDLTKEREFAKVEAEFNVRKKTDSLAFVSAIKDEEIAQRKLERNGSVVLVGLVGLVGFLFVNRQNIKRKKLRAEKELADNKLKSAQHRLSIFTKSLSEKNQLIENFTEEIERLQALPCSNELPDTKENLAKLQRSIILTDEQWGDFKELFDQVHEGYLYRLKEKLPELTAAETRYMALCKLKLSNKEMANMLGIGLSGMRNYKYRLNKKINISDDESFDQLVENI